MTRSIDHDLCSELLGAFARRELEAGDATAVEAHLDACADCSEELAALRALLAAQPEPLGEDDRRELRRAVLERVEPAAGGDVYPIRSERRWVRAAPVLAGAATLLLLVVGATLLGPWTGGQHADDSEQSGAAGPAVPEGLPTPVFAGPPESAAGTAASGEAADDASALTARSAAPTPEVRPAGTGDSLEERELALGGQQPFISFAGAFGSEDVADYRDLYTDLLVDAAPEPAMKRQIRDCSASAYESSPLPILPAYAAEVEFEEQGALLLGYVWTSSSGPLDQYMVWVWPLGSCEVPLSYQTGRIRR